MTTATQARKPFTGWHMLAILIAFFGVVISVNVLMAWYANSSWSGLISKDTYVASQDFNIEAAKARAWAAEGFKGQFTVKDKMLEYTLAGPAAKIGPLNEIAAIFHRPVGDKQDFTLVLKSAGILKSTGVLKSTGPGSKAGEGFYTSDHNLPVGQWIVDLAAIDGGKTVFHEARRVYIAEKKK